MNFWEELKKTCQLGIEKPRATRLCKQDWIILANLAIKEQAYRNELEKCIENTAKKHDRMLDFLGLPYDASLVESVIVSLLGSDGECLIWDCDGSLEKFNQMTYKADGSHPDIKSLEEYYDKEVKKEGEHE